MQTIELATTGRRTTRLGYGCSSLMGAMDRKRSLVMLEAAYDAGIRHFDVAPMYGFGQAEGCVGEFLTRHRGDITVTTKYGIPPPKRQGLLSLARSIARPVVHAMPGLKRGLLQAASKASAPKERPSFSVQEAQESLERSLRELKTERIDIWLLHEAAADDLCNDGLLRLLEDSVTAGKIGAFGVGSERTKAEALMKVRPDYCRVVQFEWSVMDQPVADTNNFRIHHRALTEKFRSLHGELVTDKSKAERWSQETGADCADREMLAALILKAALVENPESILLFSSKDPEHMRHNVAVADDATLVEPARRLYSLAQSARRN